MSIKQWAKSRLTDGAASVGYELLPAWKFERQPLVRHLKKLFAWQRIDCVFDVGGNLGQYHDLLREDVGFDGWILSFEPVAKYIAILQDKARADPRWRVFDHALGSADTTATIHVTQSPGLNSFLAPRTDAVEGFWRDDSVSHMETVQIKRLDGLFAALKSELGFQRPYLKLDTQGFDLEVVKGAGATLHEMLSMQTEASVQPLYEGMPTHDETRLHLEREGFALSGLFAVSIDAQMRLIEYDCVLVNSRRGAA